MISKVVGYQTITLLPANHSHQKGGHQQLVRFVGIPYQHGNGFFTGLFRKALPFIAKTLLPHVAKAGQAIVEDIARGQNIKRSGRKRLAGAAKNIGSELLKKAGQKILQTGKGIKRRKVVQKNKKRTIKRRKKNSKNRLRDIKLNDVFD